IGITGAADAVVVEVRFRHACAGFDRVERPAAGGEHGPCRLIGCDAEIPGRNYPRGRLETIRLRANARGGRECRNTERRIQERAAVCHRSTSCRRRRPGGARGRLPDAFAETRLRAMTAIVEGWWLGAGSNRRPQHYECRALTV